MKAEEILDDIESCYDVNQQIGLLHTYARIQIKKDRERVIKQLTTLPGSGASQYIISTVPITLD